MSAYLTASETSDWNGKQEDAVMWLNRGSTYENNVEARKDICLIKHGFRIPSDCTEYDAFTEQMHLREQLFVDGIHTVNPHYSWHL